MQYPKSEISDNVIEAVDFSAFLIENDLKEVR